MLGKVKYGEAHKFSTSNNQSTQSHTQSQSETCYSLFGKLRRLPPQLTPSQKNGMVIATVVTLIVALAAVVIAAHYGKIGMAAKEFINQKIPAFFTQKIPGFFDHKFVSFVKDQVGPALKSAAHKVEHFMTLSLPFTHGKLPVWTLLTGAASGYLIMSLGAGIYELYKNSQKQSTDSPLTLAPLEEEGEDVQGVYKNTKYNFTAQNNSLILSKEEEQQQQDSNLKPTTAVEEHESMETYIRGIGGNFEEWKKNFDSLKENQNTNY